MSVATEPESAHEPPYVEPQIEADDPDDKKQETKAKTPAGPEIAASRTDYIHICDQYPPIVLEALKRQPLPNSSLETLSDDSSAFIEQIPRTYIPRSAPRAAFQFPRYPYPHLQARLWNTAPTSYPMQWLQELDRGPDRYA